MMQFVDAREWSGIPKSNDQDSYIVDIHPLSDKADVVKAIGSVLSGEDSPRLILGNLNALNDVMSDWFFEQWGFKKNIYIKNWDIVVKLDKYLAMSLIDIFNSAFLGAVYSKALDGECSDITEEIKRLHIYLLCEEFNSQ